MDTLRIAAPHHIAKAPDGVDQLVGKGLVHLVAQVPDVYIHNIGVVVKVEVPDVVGDLGAGQDLPLVAQQVLQQGVLLGGQQQLFPALWTVLEAVSITRSSSFNTGLRTSLWRRSRARTRASSSSKENGFTR